MVSVYILRCSDSSFYVGRTSDLALRLWQHNEGTGSAYTAKNRPVALAYSEEFKSDALARARERQFKRWTRAKKEALIAGNLR